MMKRVFTVGELRQIIKDLPDYAPVYPVWDDSGFLHSPVIGIAGADAMMGGETGTGLYLGIHLLEDDDG